MVQCFSLCPFPTNSVQPCILLLQIKSAAACCWIPSSYPDSQFSHYILLLDFFTTACKMATSKCAAQAHSLPSGCHFLFLFTSIQYALLAMCWNYSPVLSDHLTLGLTEVSNQQLNSRLWTISSILLNCKHTGSFSSSCGNWLLKR